MFVKRYDDSYLLFGDKILKRGVFMIKLFVLYITLFIVACSSPEPVENVNPEDYIYLTLEELSVFDGREGRNAYIAIDGVIYDVSNSSQWPNGLHRGRVQAGQDLTFVLDTESSHGREMLERVPKIGYLVDES